MKTPTIVYILIAFLILIGGILFFNREPVLAPDPVSPIITEPQPTPTPAPQIVSYGTVNAKLGQTITFPDFSLSPLSVESDSRCPSDVTCVWAGTLTVKANLVNGTGTTTKVFEIGKELQYGNFTLTLVSSTPTPNSKQSIAPSDYQFVFSVIKKAPVVVTPPAGKCYVGGCSSQICSDRADMASTCIYREEYACYKTAKCERQSTGQCGWTPSATLNMCIQNAQNTSSDNLPQ